jgi:hypothetical protein
MPFLVTWTTVTRPNTDVEFYKFTDEDLSHIDKAYTKTGLLHSFTETVSDDGLVKTAKWIWFVNIASEAFLVHRQIAQDKILEAITAKATAHNAANGLIRSTMYFDVRDDDGQLFDRDDLPSDLWFIKDSLFNEHGHDQSFKHRLT